jgi:hypothetical protein
MNNYQQTKVSLKQANDMGQTNAYTVAITDAAGTRKHTVWTGPKGRGLWIDGRQVEGNLQFSAGKNPSAAIRRYFSK